MCASYTAEPDARRQGNVRMLTQAAGWALPSGDPSQTAESADAASCHSVTPPAVSARQ